MQIIIVMQMIDLVSTKGKAHHKKVLLSLQPCDWRGNFPLPQNYFSHKFQSCSLQMHVSEKLIDKHFGRNFESSVCSERPWSTSCFYVSEFLQGLTTM